MPDSGNNINIASNIRIEPGVTHTYTLTIHFLNKDEEQNDNTGKSISGKIKISTASTSDGYGLASEIIKNNTPSSYATMPGSATATTDEGLISGAEDNDGNTLYFRGNVSDNYVSFANQLWRVIRINGDGSVRMILNGNTGTSSKWASTSTTSSYDTMVSNLTYTNSPIKTAIETWYSNNIANNANYKKYIVKSDYCSDLSHTGKTNSSTISLGTTRRLTNPTFKCPSKYTYNLNIGLVNADEVLFAGGKFDTNNTSYYLYNSSWSWTMSPAYWYNNNYTNLYILGTTSSRFDIGAQNSSNSRPVINLKGDTPVVTNVSNPGTSSNPYVVGTASQTLGEPGKVKFTEINTTSVKISWETAANATYYVVSRKKGTDSYSVIKSNFSSNEFTDSSLLENTSYTYKVQACNSGGCSNATKASTITTGISVGSIASFTTDEIGSISVDLTWTAATNATYYKLERKTGLEGYYTVNKSISGTSYTDEITNEVTTYTYRIRGCAKNDSGVEYCGSAITQNVTTDVYVGSGEIPIEEDITPTTTVIRWSEGANADYYKIERKINGEAEFTEISNNTTTLDFTDAGLIPDTIYIYKITACARNNDNEEVCSEAVYLTIRTAPTIGDISTLTYSNLDTNSLTLNWTSAANASFYKVERKISTESNYTVLDSNYAAISKDETNLLDVTTYNYRVTPCTLSQTGTTYCGNSKTLTVRTLTVLLSEAITNIAPTTTGTLLNGLIKVDHPATTQTTAATAYRYSGANPNNYVSFNSETWRIIGVFKVDDGNGTYEDRVKIINPTKITGVAFNSQAQYVWNGSNVQTQLARRSCASNSYVANAKWYLGKNKTGQTAASAYSLERSSNNPASWTGKVGLIYPSDYGYASSECMAGATSMSTYSDSCYSSDWLHFDDHSSVTYWTITPANDGSDWAYYVYKDGNIQRNTVTMSFPVVREVVYLKASIIKTGGTGTSSNPYTISDS